MNPYRSLAAATAGALALVAAVAGAAHAQSTTASAPAPFAPPTTTSAPPPDAITADIRVELGNPKDSGPLVFEVIGVVVGDGPEMINPSPASNPSEYDCGDATVDISLDPATITLSGGENFCDFSEAYYEVTLHGASFASVTITSNDLFEVPLDEALGANGGFFKSRGLHLASTDAFPVLDSYGVSGSVFAARWSGASTSQMSGVANFTFARTAPAASGAGGSPVFTG